MQAEGNQVCQVVVSGEGIVIWQVGKAKSTSTSYIAQRVLNCGPVCVGWAACETAMVANGKDKVRARVQGGVEEQANCLQVAALELV